MRAVVDAVKQVRTSAGTVERDLIGVDRRAEYRRVVKALESLIHTYDGLIAGELARRQRAGTNP